MMNVTEFLDVVNEVRCFHVMNVMCDWMFGSDEIDWMFGNDNWTFSVDETKFDV